MNIAAKLAEGIICIDCNDKGEILNRIAGTMDSCRNCDGTGRVTPCEAGSYSKPAVFRNRKCNTCGATDAQHEAIRELMILVDAATANV